MTCPTCGRPVTLTAYGRVPTHTDLRTGARSICPASGRMPEHCETRPERGAGGSLPRDTGPAGTQATVTSGDGDG